MKKEDVQTPAEAALYILDCNLATVSYMAGLKSTKKRNQFVYERQISIAQLQFDWIEKFGIETELQSRGEMVQEFFNGSVERWAKHYEV